MWSVTIALAALITAGTVMIGTGLKEGLASTLTRAITIDACNAAAATGPGKEAYETLKKIYEWREKYPSPSPEHLAQYVRNEAWWRRERERVDPDYKRCVDTATTAAVTRTSAGGTRATAAETSYLATESFDLPLDQTERQTAKPLAPGGRYRIIIASDSFNLAGLHNGALLFMDDTRAFAPSTGSYLRRDARGVVSMLEFLIEGRGDRLKVRSTAHAYSPLLGCTYNCAARTVVVRLIVSEVLPQPAPQPRSVAFATPAPTLLTAPLSSPPVPSNPLAKLPAPWLLTLGCIALAALVWRVIVYMRRRQLRVTLRRLMADIQRVEKARRTVHHHLDKEF